MWSSLKPRTASHCNSTAHCIISEWKMNNHNRVLQTCSLCYLCAVTQLSSQKILAVSIPHKSEAYWITDTRQTSRTKRLQFTWRNYHNYLNETLFTHAQLNYLLGFRIVYAHRLHHGKWIELLWEENFVCDTLCSVLWWTAKHHRRLVGRPEKFDWGESPQVQLCNRPKNAGTISLWLTRQHFEQHAHVRNGRKCFFLYSRRLSKLFVNL